MNIFKDQLALLLTTILCLVFIQPTIAGGSDVDYSNANTLPPFAFLPLSEFEALSSSNQIEYSFILRQYILACQSTVQPINVTQDRERMHFMGLTQPQLDTCLAICRKVTHQRAGTTHWLQLSDFKNLNTQSQVAYAERLIAWSALPPNQKPAMTYADSNKEYDITPSQTTYDTPKATGQFQLPPIPPAGIDPFNALVGYAQGFKCGYMDSQSAGSAGILYAQSTGRSSKNVLQSINADLKQRYEIEVQELKAELQIQQQSNQVIESMLVGYRPGYDEGCLAGAQELTPMISLVRAGVQPSKDEMTGKRNQRMKFAIFSKARAMGLREADALNAAKMVME